MWFLASDSEQSGVGNDGRGENSGDNGESGEEVDDEQKVIKYPGPSLEEYKSGRGREAIKVSINGFILCFHVLKPYSLEN